MEVTEKLNRMLNQLEIELPKIVQKYPDADQGDFWLAFAERANVIESVGGSDHAQHVQLRIDQMLVAHNILPAEILQPDVDKYADPKAPSSIASAALTQEIGTRSTAHAQDGS